MKSQDTLRPYALFVLVDADIELVNEVLKKVQHSRDVADFWLATDNYAEAPAARDHPHDKRNGTFPGTVKDDLKSPFVGKSLDDIVELLRTKPDTCGLTSYLFAILDNGVHRDQDPRTMVICKTDDQACKDGATVCLRYPVDEAGVQLGHLDKQAPEDWREQPETQIDYGPRVLRSGRAFAS